MSDPRLAQMSGCAEVLISVTMTFAPASQDIFSGPAKAGHVVALARRTCKRRRRSLVGSSP
jgi:hypothetical protein